MLVAPSVLQDGRLKQGHWTAEMKRLMWRKARVGGGGQRDGLSRQELTASYCLLQTIARSQLSQRQFSAASCLCKVADLCSSLQGESFRERLTSSRWSGAGPRFGRSVKMIPLPHIVSRRAPKSRLNMCTTSLCTADSNSCLQSGSLFCTHPQAWAVVSFSSWFKVQSDSNQSFLCSSVLPSLRALTWHLLWRWTKLKLFNVLLVFRTDVDRRNCKMILHNPYLSTVVQLHSSSNLFACMYWAVLMPVFPYTLKSFFLRERLEVKN